MPLQWSTPASKVLRMMLKCYRLRFYLRVIRRSFVYAAKSRISCLGKMFALWLALAPDEGIKY